MQTDNNEALQKRIAKTIVVLDFYRLLADYSIEK